MQSTVDTTHRIAYDLPLGTLLRAIAKTFATCLALPYKSALIEAETLAAYALSRTREKLVVRGGETLTDDEATRMKDVVTRRLAYEPVAYITGEKEFYGLSFRVDTRVLIPRPETEELVDHVIHAMKGDERVLDVGTGSGCVAVTVKHLFPGTDVAACDVSDDALAVAKENARRILSENAILFYRGDINTLAMPLKYDILIANLPYVEKETMACLSQSVRYEPALALDGGDDGLLLYRALIGRLSALVRKGGRFFFEVGFMQGREVAALCHHAGYSAEVKRDLSRKERFVEGVVS